jgi:PAS domain S-box-containing protein
VNDFEKSKDQLIQELEDLRRKMADFQKTKTENNKLLEFFDPQGKTFFEIFENDPHGIAQISKEGYYLYVNPRFMEITGYTLEDVPTGKEWFRKAYPDPDYRKQVMEAWKEDSTKLVQGKGFEFRITCRDGSFKDIEFRTTYLKNYDITVLIDVTKRRQAESALQESERRLSKFIDFFPDPILAINKDKEVIIWNRAIEEMTGVPAKEMIGKGDYQYTIPFYGYPRPQFMDLFWEPEHDIASKYSAIKREGDNLVGEAYCPALYGGKGAHIWVKASPLRDAEGRLLGVIECIRDISDQKKAQAKLRESEERYRTVIEESNDGIALVRGDQHIYVNQQLVKMFGYDRPEEIIGQPTSFLVHPDDQERVMAINRLRQRGESVSPRYDFKGRHKNGQPVYIEVSAARTIYQGETVSLAYLRDIGDRKQAEQLRRDLELRLQRAEKMEALGLLAGGVAHDLNNVLGIVMGYSELLIYEIDPSSPLRPNLESILEASQRATAIVQDLLTLARRGISSRLVLNLNQIIKDSLHSLEFQNLSVYHPSVQITMDLAPDLLNMSGSAIHLSKTLFNLVSNASEAMPQGGSVTIKTSNQYLDRPIQGYEEVKEGEYIVLSVSDTGEGISAMDLKKIFEPFYTKKVMGRSGTGLGLAVVWGTVKDHDGYINVQSDVGKGSIFNLYFPVTRESLFEEAENISVFDYLGKGETILVVDDVKGQRDLAQKMLKKLNYQVSAVAGGEEALSFLQDHPVDLVILDMIMDPGIDGLETYKRILEIHPHQKAIIVSGFSETERVNAAQAFGAGAYVKKPYLLEKIGLAVRKELDK